MLLGGRELHRATQLNLMTANEWQHANWTKVRKRVDAQAIKWEEVAAISRHCTLCHARGQIVRDS